MDYSLRIPGANFAFRTGVLCILLCFALGIANFFHLSKPIIILFSAICLYVSLSFSVPLTLPTSSVQANTYSRVCSFIIIFIEIPLLLRICPTSPVFDNFIRKFETNYMRAAIYFVMSVIQWISISVDVTSLIAAAVMLLVAAVFYALAGVKGQAFQGSKTLGGHGVAQMII